MGKKKEGMSIIEGFLAEAEVVRKLKIARNVEMEEFIHLTGHSKELVIDTFEEWVKRDGTNEMPRYALEKGENPSDTAVALMMSSPSYPFIITLNKGWFEKEDKEETD